jgi:hypothetical protein
MKKLAFGVALVALLAMGSAANAVVGANDDVPAQSLLLPYFEVNLADPSGVTTLFSINNASAGSAVAHVTFWTDESVPTLDFDVYLTGFDVQTINIRDIFNGDLPVTADDNNDPGDANSPQGGLSDDDVWPGSTGPCAAPAYPAGLDTILVNHLIEAHTGGSSPVFGRCAGANYGDDIARGYVTVDVVTSCNLSFPSTAGYFTLFSPADPARNVLWGDYFYVNAGENFAQGETLVHLEFGNLTIPSFYERYNAVAGEDGREALPAVWGTRYLNGGAFDGGTDLIVWRDSELASNLTGFTCGSNASWFPLSQTDVVAFDEEEQEEDLCFSDSPVSPPLGGANTCFPLEAQRVSVADGSLIADAMAPSALFGWLYIDLEHTAAGGVPYPSQAWLTTVMDAEGRFSVGFDGIQLGASTGGLLP